MLLVINALTWWLFSYNCDDMMSSLSTLQKCYDEFGSATKLYNVEGVRIWVKLVNDEILIHMFGGTIHAYQKRKVRWKSISHVWRQYTCICMVITNDID